MKKQTNNAQGPAADPKIKNIIIAVLAVIFLFYVVMIYIVPIGFNDKLRNKDIIPELEKLTNLRVNYDSAMLKITPNFNVIVRFNNLRAEKRDVEQKVASASTAVVVLDPMMLVSKHYNLKAFEMTGVEYYEVIDNGTPEIVTFLQNYSLLSVAGPQYKLKLCPLDIRYFFKYTYDSSSGAYFETRKNNYNIDADTMARFLETASNGAVKART